MLMQTVGLHDRIDLYVTQEPGIKIETNLFYLPDNEQNLAHKAARLLMEEFGIRQGLSIHLRKFIPVSAGMAGGSTDAASVLFGVNKMFGLGLVHRGTDGTGRDPWRGRPVLHHARDCACGRDRGEADQTPCHAKVPSAHRKAADFRVHKARL